MNEMNINSKWLLAAVLTLMLSCSPLAASGLTIDYHRGLIRVPCHTTSVTTNEPVEFLLVSRHSGHDYESLLTTDVEPQELYAALLKLGMSPGQSIDYSALKMWPAGERAVIMAEWTYDQVSQQIPAEELIIQEPSGRPLASDGFVFTGSYQLEEGTEPPMLAAQYQEPHAMISLYNEPNTLFDVPHKAPQGQVYNTQYLNPDYMLPSNYPMTLLIQPQLVPGGRSIQMTLTCAQKESALVYRLLDAQQQLVTTGESLEPILDALSKQIQSHHDVYLSFVPEADVAAEDLVRHAYILETFDQQGVIRMTPSFYTNELFYKAYLPNAAYLDREKRPDQPWEIHVRKHGEETFAQLIDIDMQWESENPDPTLTVQKMRVTSPDAAARQMSSATNHLPVVFFYSAPQFPYKEIHQWQQALKDVCPTFYLVIER